MTSPGHPPRRSAGTPGRPGRPGPRRTPAAERHPRGVGWREGIDLPQHAFPSLIAWAALLLLAAPVHNGFWGVNGFRSLGVDGRIGLLLAAAVTPLLLQVRSRTLALGIGLAVALMLAFPLRERLHFLGDTAVRLRAMAVFTADMISVSIAEWSTRLHANPLDILIGFLVPIGLRRLGASILAGVSLVSVALLLAYLAGLWRATGRLAVAAGLRPALCAAIALAGTLEAFAGYAESAGLLLASAAWWWAEMLAPLDRPSQALRTAGAWLAMALSHRLGLVMLLPLAWRALGPPLPGDRPETRRRLLILSGVAALLAIGAMQLGGGGRQLGTDLRDMMGALSVVIRAVPPADYFNTLALVAPLVWLAPWLAGGAALASFARRPAVQPLLAGSLVSLPLMWTVPANSHGLGAHRDWDLAALGGLTLSLTAAALLATLAAGRLRGALLCALPLLALGAGGWVLVNANDQAIVGRARALAEQPPGLIEDHEANLHGWLGQRAMDLGEPAFAAPELERAFDLNRNPRRALMAAEAWALAGDLPRARAALARARATGELTPTGQESARRLDQMLVRMAGDSAAAAPDTGR